MGLSNLPFSERVMRAAAARQNMLRPARGLQQNQFVPGEELVPSGFEGLPPGHPGSGFIGAPGMVRGEVSPEIDAALLRQATDTQGMGRSRLPEAADVHPVTAEEEEIGIRSVIAPGSSPYLPHQTEAPSVGWWDRTKAMNFAQTPEGMAEHFRSIGINARTIPTDLFAERENPLLAEIESGHGFNVAIQEPTTGEWHVLDPEGIEWKDFTDIGTDLALMVGGVKGANWAQRGMRAGRAAKAAQAADDLSAGALKAAKGGVVDKNALVAGARETAERAATPTTDLLPRIGGAMLGTVPPEAARQGATLSGLIDLPEEGTPTRAVRGGMEVIAGGAGELFDPVQGLRGLSAFRQGKAIKAARKAGVEPAQFEDIPSIERLGSQFDQEKGLYEDEIKKISDLINDH